MGAAYRHAARVEITTRDGKRLHHEILHRRGSPENPLSAYEVEQKFRNVAAGCLAPSAMEQIVQQVESIERMASVAPLLELLAAERPAEFVR